MVQSQRRWKWLPGTEAVTVEMTQHYHFDKARFSSLDEAVTNQTTYRDAEHGSTDPQRHMTVECFDKDGKKIETVHVPAPEPKDGKK